LRFTKLPFRCSGTYGELARFKFEPLSRGANSLRHTVRMMDIPATRATASAQTAPEKSNNTSANPSYWTPEKNQWIEDPDAPGTSV
jgi:hypothetical protein